MLIAISCNLSFRDSSRQKSTLYAGAVSSYSVILTRPYFHTVILTPFLIFTRLILLALIFATRAKLKAAQVET